MKHSRNLTRRQFLILTSTTAGGVLSGSAAETKNTKIVSLKDAHIGTLEIDLRIMNQYGEQPQELQDFYIASREALTGKNPEPAMAAVCQKFKRTKIGGPMLGNLSATGVSVWMHLPEPTKVKVRVIPANGGETKTFVSSEAARIQCVTCEELSPDSAYTYEVTDTTSEEQNMIGNGSFVTPPAELSEKPYRIAFGTCYHKVGMYKPELMQLIRERDNRAMLVLGDSAVDGRKDNYGLINTDYLLRNLSTPWQQLAANVPISATWDDHDYWGNDTSGTRTNGKKPIDVVGLRKSWNTNWNNPERNVEREGIYFTSQLGPVQHIALDTRSCRVNKERGKRNSYLGKQQRDWLKQQIESSTSPCILISSGTMWSDYISDGKDSWGKWDKEGREEIFQWIDAKQDTLVILLSGDRHGARGFAIPRPNGKHIYELEIACMGGVPGPAPFAKDREHQLFGYKSGTWAFGELTFSSEKGSLKSIFRMIDENGKELETISLNRR